MRSGSATITPSGTFTHRLTEISMFFDGTDAVHQTMKNVVAAFDAAGIQYAIVGGMAVNAHRHSRTTKDVDFLITATGWAALQKMVTAGQFQTTPGRSRRFVDPATNVSIDILITGGFPGSGEPGPIAYPNPADVSQVMDHLHVVDLPNLIVLRLAAHRFQDFADVVNLIRENHLDESFGQNLPVSLQADFIECLEEMRREDQYESRRDQSTP